MNQLEFGTFIKIDGLYGINVDSLKEIPIQIECKCFFVSQQNRFSSREIAPDCAEDRQNTKQFLTILKIRQTDTQLKLKNSYTLI